MKPALQHNWPREAVAGGTAGGVWAAEERISKIKEALEPLDGHPTATAARIVS